MKFDPTLAEFAETGTLLFVKVQPKSRENRVWVEGETLRVQVTAAPVDGKANTAVVKLLSKALGIPKSRLELVRDDKSRDKVFRIL